MPSYTRGETRENLTLVRVNSSESTLYYGWKSKDLASETNVATSDLIALGHTNFENLASGSIYTLRAQAPKPGRCNKIIRRNPTVVQKGSVSTFYGAGSLKTALAAGWNPIKRPRTVSLTNTPRYVTAVAELSNGVFYVFPLNKADFETYKAALGLKAPREVRSTAERNRLVRGASVPRPGRVGKDLGDGKTFSTFFSTESESSALDTDLKLIEREYIGA